MKIGGSAETEGVRGRGQHRTVVYLLLMFVILYTISAPGHQWGGDGGTRLQVAMSLVEGRGWTVSPQVTGMGYRAQGNDGRWYSIYGMGQSLVYVPFAIAGKALARFTSLAELGAVELVASFLNPILGALLCAAFFILLSTLRYSRTVAFWLVCALGLGTIIWPHTRDNYDHIQATLLLTASLCLLLQFRADEDKSRTHLVISGALAGAAFITRIDSVWFILGLVVLVSIEALSERDASLGLMSVARSALGDLLLLGVGALPFLLAFAIYNYCRFGSPLETGYTIVFARDQLPALGQDWRVGLYKFLVSPGRGLLIYSPIVLIFFAGLPTFWRRHTSVALATVVTIVLSVGFFAQFGAISPRTWGPRQLTPILPLLLLPGAEVVRKARVARWSCVLLNLLLVISILVQIPAVASSTVQPLWEASLQGATAYDLTFKWEYCTLFRQYRHFFRSVPATFRGEQYQFARWGDFPQEELIRRQIAVNVVNWWWILGYYYGLRWLISFPFVALILLVAIGRGLRHRLCAAEEGWCLCHA